MGGGRNGKGGCGCGRGSMDCIGDYLRNDFQFFSEGPDQMICRSRANYA
jgi:hypothetical protein